MSELKRGYKQTEVGVIPEDWEVVSLGDHVRITSGESPSLFKFLSDGIPYFKVDQLNSDGKLLAATPYFFAGGRTVAKGSIIFPKRGASIMLNKVRILANDSFMDTNLMALTPAETISKDYLYYGLIHIGLWRVADTTSIPQINNKHIQPLLLALPPLPEQRAIAGVLGDVDALIGALDRLIAKKRDLKQAAMQQLLTGQTRLPGFVSKPGFKETEVGLIPMDWDVRPLLSVLRVANGQVDPKTDPYKSMTLVAPDHIESGTGRLLARQTAAEQKAISGKYLFAKGDVIYSKIRPYLRKAVLAEFEGLCSADMYPLKPVGDTSPGFMLAVILGHRFSTFAESVSVRSGMPKINRSEMAEYALAVPPAPEQTAIASVLSDMDAEISVLEKQRDKTRLVKQGMMQELLTGRIRLS